MEIIPNIIKYFNTHPLDDSLLLTLQLFREKDEVEIIFEPTEFFWKGHDYFAEKKSNSGVIKRHFKRFLFQGVDDLVVNKKRTLGTQNQDLVYSATKNESSTYTIDSFKIISKNSKFRILIPISSFGKVSFNFDYLWEESRVADVVEGMNNTWVYLDSVTKKEFDFYSPFADY